MHLNAEVSGLTDSKKPVVNSDKANCKASAYFRRMFLPSREMSNDLESHRLDSLNTEQSVAGTESSGVEQRMRWDSYMEYFLSIIGFVIDLGNVWRYTTFN